MANQKLSDAEITAITAPALTDLLYIVDGTPESHKVTVGDLWHVMATLFDVRNYGVIGAGNDTLIIQAAIDAARGANGGVVYLPPGIYVLTDRLEIYDCDNVTLRGAGKGLTVLDASLLTVMVGRHELIGPGVWPGVITVAPSNGQPELENIALEDFSLLGSVTTCNGWPILIGGTVNCAVRRIKVDGAVKEAIYSDPFEGFGFTLDNLVVEECEVCNFQMNGINTNIPVVAHGVTVRNNYIHHGYHGVNMIGHAVAIENNYFNDCAVGITVTADSATDLHGISVIGNRIENTGLSGGGGGFGYIGILAHAPAAASGCGFLIANNTVLPMQKSGPSIMTYGPWMIDGNILCGGYSAAPSMWERAIWIRPSPADTRASIVQCCNNVIESSGADHQYATGIFIDNDAGLTVHCSNNLVRPLALHGTGSYGGYYDARGASTLDGDVFYGKLSIGVSEINAGGELDGKPLHYGDVGAGAIVANKATALEWGNGLIHKTVLTFTLTGANDLDLANGADHGTGVKVYDFPEGRIHIIGATIAAIIVNNGAFNADPNDVFYLSCGSVVAADDGTLTGTEADIIPATTMDTSSGAGLVLLWNNALGASAEWDGTGTALALYVNAAVADVCTSGAVTIAIIGTMTIHWINLGDY